MTSTSFEWGAQRVALLVDTQNLYYAARAHSAGAVDYRRLLAAAVRGRRAAHATAYVVDRDGDTTAHGFYAKLGALGYRVKRLRLRVHRGEEAGPVVEGDWDMGIAADMVRALDQVDVIALASGDADFVPFVELAQQRGVRVEVLAFRDSTGQSLLDAADAYTNLAELEGIFLPNR
ncbi:MAG TPA: NYN domain-containing protein [Trueperaceae bacterium]|nr:NYN domain-containing protein [Trueperaceae bacterium]